MPTENQELKSIFSIVWDRRKLAFSVVGFTVIAGLTYTIVTPAVWEAKATIVFPVRTPSILGTGSFEQSGLAASLTGGPTPLKIFGGMIESERAIGYVSDMADLTRRTIKDMRTIQDSPSQNSITVSARHTNKDLAKRVVSLHLDALTKINNSISKPLVSDDAVVLKAQVDAQKKALVKSENELLAFQQSAQTAPSIASSGSGRESTIVPNAGRWSELLQSLQLQFVTLNTSIKDAQSRIRTMSTSLKDLQPRFHQSKNGVEN